jgi:DNA-directed RNA polymerase specialized sigma24 family protein
MAKKKTARKKLTKGVWTKTDLATLKKAFGNCSTADVAAKLGRPLDAVKKKASRMGLKKTRKYMKTLGRG